MTGDLLTLRTVSAAISRPTPESTRAARVSIDRDAIAANWRYFDKLSGRAECAAVVKADAYGLGAVAAAKALKDAGARSFFTASLEEALEVRPVIGGECDLYVLNGPDAENAARFTEARCIPVLNSLEQIAVWRSRAAAAVHIDTGMNRLGLAPGDVAQAGALLAGGDLKLIMSHLACASDVDHEMNARQRSRFLAAAAQLPQARLSLAATSGALIGAPYHLDMIRPGVGLYGSGGLDANNPELAVTVRIHAPVLQVRDVAAGETFGYGALSRATKPARTVTVGIGYADGFLRSFAGRGYGMLDGLKLPLLGRVSMDLLILDAANAPHVKAGDWVEFLGDHARLDEVASAAGTAPYEILTTLAGGVRKSQSGQAS